jgi:hypothetical protein
MSKQLAFLALKFKYTPRMRNLDGWMTGQMDGKDDHQGYYISRHQREGRERERE